jgi:predicted nucleic acid-binding protein
MILLDTDIMVDILRDYPPAVQWMQSLGDEAIALPGFVVMELIQGCQTKIELTNIRKRLAQFQVYWPEVDDCNQAVEIFAQYHLSHQTGIIDVLIGQLAVSTNGSLYTFNKKHYSPIPGLKTVQPYRKE